MFNTFAHKPYIQYKETAVALQARHPHLQPTSPNAVFAATTINMGTQSFLPLHVNAGNSPGGWCVATSFGPFNPDKGGHLVLWNMKLIIRFLPGSSILFPSALITHSNTPIQPGEKRYSMIQYSAGALFWWRYNGFRSDKAFLASATCEQLQKREEDRRECWSRALANFSRWEDVLTGDWKGDQRWHTSEQKENGLD